MTQISQSIEIKATKKKAYGVISDFESYSEFLPEMKKVVVEKKKAQHYLVTFTLQVIKEISYTLDIHGKQPDHLTWTLVRGNMMKKNDGGWTLEDVKRGVILATYDVDIDLGLLVPSSVTKALVSKDLPKMLERFKERIESL